MWRPGVWSTKHKKPTSGVVTSPPSCRATRRFGPWHFKSFNKIKIRKSVCGGIFAHHKRLIREIRVDTVMLASAATATVDNFATTFRIQTHALMNRNCSSYQNSLRQLPALCVLNFWIWLRIIYQPTAKTITWTTGTFWPYMAENRTHRGQEIQPLTCLYNTSADVEG